MKDNSDYVGGRDPNRMLILAATALSFLGAEGKDQRKMLLGSGYNMQVWLFMSNLRHSKYDGDA